MRSPGGPRGSSTYQLPAPFKDADELRRLDEIDACSAHGDPKNCEYDEAGNHLTPRRGPWRLSPGNTETRFLRFHDLNPDVLPTLAQLAYELKNKGHSKGSIAMLFEVFRWEVMKRMTDPSASFKISNDYKPYYARLLMDTYPGLKGFFVLKKMSR